jgi:hypothetical protein
MIGDRRVDGVTAVLADAHPGHPEDDGDRRGGLPSARCERVYVMNPFDDPDGMFLV